MRLLEQRDAFEVALGELNDQIKTVAEAEFLMECLHAHRKAKTQTKPPRFC